MAFISGDSGRLPGQQREQQMVSGGSGMLGQGMLGSGKKQTQAGTGGSWYNVQDFLSANQNIPSSLANRMEQKGQEEIGQAASGLQSNIANMSALPQAQQYSQEAFQNAIGDKDYSDVQQYLNQGYQAQNVNLAPQGYESQKQSYQSLNPNDFSSLMNWFGATDQGARYTPGMSKMDELLLRNRPGFIESFPQQLQSQFQSQVTDPMQAATSERQAQEQATQDAFNTSRENWQQGLSDYLGGQYQSVQDELAKQQDVQDQWLANEANYNRMISQHSPQAQEFGMDLNPYFQYQAGTAPAMGTAANVALGGEGIQEYNQLANLLEDVQGSPMERMMDQQYVAPTYLGNEQGFMQAYAPQKVTKTQGEISANEAARQAQYNQAIQLMGPETYQHMQSLGITNPNDYINLLNWQAANSQYGGYGVGEHLLNAANIWNTANAVYNPLIQQGQNTIQGLQQYLS